MFKDNPIIYLAKKEWEFSRGKRANVILYVTMFVIANLLIFTEPLIIGKVLNIIQEQGINDSSIKSITFFLFLFILTTIACWVFHGPARVIERKNAFYVRNSYRMQMLNGVMNLPLEWHSDHHSGNTIDRVQKAANALYSFSSNTYEIIEAIVRFTSSYFALVYFDIHASYLILIMLLITGTLIIKVDKRLIKNQREYNECENKSSAKIFDVLSNITTVIVLRIEKLVGHDVATSLEKPKTAFYSYIRENEIKWFLASLLSSISLFALMLSYIYTQQNNTALLIGTVYALYTYINRMNSVFYRFAAIYSNVVTKKTELCNGEEIAADFKNKERIKKIKLGTQWRELKITTLCFSYNIQNKSQINCIDMTIHRTEKIAIIGESGGGKTTFLKLMRGLYDFNSGIIKIDNKTLQHGFKELSPNIALIPQDPEIFARTIRENITIGLNKSETEIKKYSDIACFSEVIARLPNKLESRIHEKGVNLSGGEKQRLALTRGLLFSKDKEIILLDEATSSVDVKNEIKIYENILKEFKDKTVIASIHRLHLLTMFDMIYFFKDGEIIAKGSFNELLKDSSEFRAMWKKYKKSKE